jgi:thiol-disulfide isomerase/thioredoxin
MMAYKPPVKSSVSKLGTNRYRSPQQHKRRTTSSSHQQQATFISTPPQDLESSSSSSPSPLPFQDRMRNMLGTRQRQQERRRDAQRRLPSNVHEVTTLQAFKEMIVMEQSSDESSASSSPRLIAVRFYAPWCKACQAVQPLFYRMANQFPNVVFLQVSVSDKNTNLHQGLGVPSLPYGHIYHPTTGLMEEGRLTKQHISAFARTLQTYVQKSCELRAVGDATNPNNNDNNNDNNEPEEEE